MKALGDHAEICSRPNNVVHVPSWVRIFGTWYFSACSLAMLISPSGSSALTSIQGDHASLSRIERQTIPPVDVEGSCFQEIEQTQGSSGSFEIRLAQADSGTDREWILRAGPLDLSVFDVGGSSAWSLKLIGFGSGDGGANLAASSVRRQSPTRVDRLWGDCLSEWYSWNGEGLEHGLVLACGPEGHALDTLHFEFEFPRSYLAVECDGAGGLLFVDPDESIGIRYANLHVFDARGVELAALMHADNGVLRIDVWAGGAQYPITVDPIIEPMNLIGSGAFPFHGPSVSISGDTAVVGSFAESSGCSGVNCDPATTGNLSGSGAAYIFERQSTGWVQRAYLKASNPDINDHFGTAVAISGDLLVIGAPDEDSSSTGINGNQLDNTAPSAGAVYVFSRIAGGWTQHAYIKPLVSSGNRYFGRAVAISDETIVVGAIGDPSGASGVNGNAFDVSKPGSGAAYIFERVGTTWSQVSYLKASNPDAGDHFGHSVAIEDDVVVVGAPLERSASTGVNGNGSDNSLANAGAAYVYTRHPWGWIGPDYVKSSNTSDSALFGHDVDIHNRVMIVGSPGHGVQQGMLARGAAYVFEQTTGPWAESAYLVAQYAEANSQFGYSVAVGDDVLLVGAPYDRVNSVGVDGPFQSPTLADAGAVDEFERTGTGWTHSHYVKSSLNQSGGQFGKRLSVDGSSALILAAGEFTSGGTWFGGVHILDLDTKSRVFCAGDGSGGVCPCSNSGAVQHGCPNSLNANGVQLRSIGVARLSFESLQLVADGASGGAGLFLQGSAALSAGWGMAFGDGLLCVGGTIRRLLIQFPTNGSAVYPVQVSVDLPLSTLGSVSAGMTVYYQFWYRDASPYCTAATFNLSNGLAVLWQL